MGNKVKTKGRRVHPCIRFAEAKKGTIISIFVKPNQPRFRVTVEKEEILISSTVEPAEGKVNKEILRELSRVFKAKVEIVSGSISRQKRILIRDKETGEIEQILNSL